MSKIKLGIVTDFRNYKGYMKNFLQDRNDKVMEIHLLESDLAHDFPIKLMELRQFVISQSIEHLAIHSLDDLMQSVLFEEEGFESNIEKFNFFIQNLKTFSNELRQEIFLVVHLGVKYSRFFLQAMSESEMKSFRKEKMEKAKEAYQRLKIIVANSYLTVALENSPPTCAAMPKDHFIDLSFEDIAEQIGKDGAFVLDICHAAMTIDYFKQNKIKFNGLEVIKDSQGNPPYSLQSIENYIKAAGKNTCWIHLSDATGFLGPDEGHVIGVEKSIIPLKSVIKTIEKYVSEPITVLEIINSHKDYGLISSSITYFEKTSIIKIKNIPLSKDRCFLIAEIASSHCGNKEKLKHIVKSYSEANADGLKFQVFNATELCSTNHPGLSDLQKIQLSLQDWKEVFAYARQFDTAIFADVFDQQSADLVESYVDAYSIHASDMSNSFLLQHVAAKKKLMLLYVGGSTFEELHRAIKILEPFNVDVVLVYGLQNFPTNIENVNLKRIKKLEEEFNLPICYHDHTDAEMDLAKTIPLLAFAYGAQLVEKHVTDDRSLKGFDYMSSLNPPEFKEMVMRVREFENMIGKDDFTLTSADMEYRKKMKKFIVAKSDLKKGELITRENISFKRAIGGQFQPFEYQKVIGRKVANDITEDMPIKNEHIERKAVILVPARMKSTRLPKKALLELEGDTTIGQMLERLKHSQKAEVILCTSFLSEDAPLIEEAKRKGVKYFAGDPDDVMDRFLKAAERENADIIVRATGDNPLMDPELIDRQITYHLVQNADYTGIEDVPIGFNAEVVNVDVLKTAREFVRDPRDTEYMTWYIKDPKHFNVKIMPVPEEEQGDFRLTLDVPEDLEVIRHVYKELYQNEKIFSIKETVSFLKAHPEIVAINSHYQQQRRPPKMKEMRKD